MKIKWALNELKKYQDYPLELDGTVDLENALKNRDNEIMSVEPIHLNGLLEVENSAIYFVNLMVETKITLPSSRSLEPVEVKIQFPFSEVYLAPRSEVSSEQFLEDEIVEELTEDVLNLQKPIEDAILTNKPTQLFTPKELEANKMPSGKNWEVLSEEDYSEQSFHNSDEEGDPRFAALKGLFNENNEEE